MNATEHARQLGADRGKAAASWTFDGNTDTATYRQFLVMAEDGDPLIDNFGPASGWLSGEYAEGPTPLELALEVGLEIDTEAPEYSEWAIDEACNAYEQAADEAYWSSLEETARRMV